MVSQSLRSPSSDGFIKSTTESFPKNPLANLPNSDKTKPNLVLLAKVHSARGLTGHLNLKIFADPETINKIKKWQWFSPDNKTNIHLTSSKTKIEGNKFTIKFLDINDRNESEKLVGGSLYALENLPKLAEQEFYYKDLIGLKVINLQEQELGEVVAVSDNNAHSIIELQQSGVDKKNGYLPFVKTYIKKIDLKNQQLIVNWLEDWFV